MIFFDLDDTILATAKTNLLIFERAQMDLHIDMDADEFRGRIRTALRSRMIRHMDFAYNETIGIDPLDYLLMEEPYEEERLELFKNGVYDDVKDILGETTKEEFFAAFLKRRFDYTEAIDGMLDLIKDLKAAGHKLGVITDGISEIQHRKAQTLGLDTLMDYVFASGDFGYGKPDTKFFFGAMKAAGVRPEESTMIGNNIDSDVFGALASGMKAIYFGAKPKNYEVLYAPDAKALREVLKKALC